MPGKAKPIPDSYQGAIPYLYCKGAARAIDFYKRAFGAEELFRMEAPGGKIGHAELRIGGARPGGGPMLMVADEHPEMDVLSPQTIGGSPVLIYVYVEDVDALAARATAAGAKVLRPLADQFYGDRSVSFEDPFGHRWGFATHIEDVAPEEIDRRAAQKYGGG
jgi:PhnB protein